MLLSYLYQGELIFHLRFFYISITRKKTKLFHLYRMHTAHMDWGKFRDALDYGHHQLGISEELDNPQMRSEAYLNLARAHEKLGNERQFFKLIPVSSLSSHLIFFFCVL